MGGINGSRIGTHARLVDRVGYIDAPLVVLSESVRVSPDHPIRWREPIMYAFISVKARTNHPQTLAGLVRCVHVERRNCGGNSQCRVARKKGSSRGRFHEISSGPTISAMPPVNFFSSP